MNEPSNMEGGSDKTSAATGEGTCPHEDTFPVNARDGVIFSGQCSPSTGLNLRAIVTLSDEERADLVWQLGALREIREETAEWKVRGAITGAGAALKAAAGAVLHAELEKAARSTMASFFREADDAALFSYGTDAAEALDESLSPEPAREVRELHRQAREVAVMIEAALAGVITWTFAGGAR